MRKVASTSTLNGLNSPSLRGISRVELVCIFTVAVLTSRIIYIAIYSGGEFAQWNILFLAVCVLDDSPCLVVEPAAKTTCDVAKCCQIFPSSRGSRAPLRLYAQE